MTTYVIVHGSWAGGWYFGDTARLMREEGHEVYTPTLTGISERVHLAHPDVNLETHIQDIVNVLEYEDLQDVVLVGYSYGGMVVTGAAQHVPQRIRQLIYLDAMVPEDGQSVADIFPDIVAYFVDVAEKVGDGWQIPHDPPHPRKTPHPLKTLTQPVKLNNPEAAKIPRAYIWFTQNSFPFAPQLAEMATKAKADGWAYRELAVDHTAPETHANDMAKILLEFA